MTALLDSSVGPAWVRDVHAGRLDAAGTVPGLRVVPPAPAPAVRDRREPLPPLRLTRRARLLLVMAGLLTVALGGTAHLLTVPVQSSIGQPAASLSGQVAPGVPLGTALSGP